MKNFIFIGLTLIVLLSCSKEKTLKITSPNTNIAVKVHVKNGNVKYVINFKDSVLIKPSNLGYLLKNSKPMNGNFSVNDFKISSSNSTWSQVWGENKVITDNFNKLEIFLQEKVEPFRKMNVVFKVYDDGVGFRYEIPKQANLDSILIMEELTEFNFSKNFDGWFTPANFDSYEQLYQNAPLNTIESANTPITFESDNQFFVSIHEANLTDYADMTLLKNKDKEFSFKSDLVPWPDGIKVKTSTPMVSPWRTIQIVDKAKDLVNSNLIVNLNEPNKIEDTSWVQPMKYVGIWWGMHLGTHTWTLGERHGATTTATKKYIDFASNNNISGVLVEGWNT
ncbi:glycoside hydrolase family 97 N-terminal domain-containing protein, partial [Lutibacter sp.]|uniref:glycoside hydrolase family 97 N-terminal domain-containing protein n=1 Tax=Lutibacter sp. TaxID=1925666 RepID=UPI0034A05DE6